MPSRSPAPKRRATATVPSQDRVPGQPALQPKRTPHPPHQAAPTLGRQKASKPGTKAQPDPKPRGSPQKSPRWSELNPLLAPTFDALLQQGGIDASSTLPELCVRALLKDACSSRSTDIHLDPFSAGWRIRFRVDGRLHDVSQIAPDLALRIVRRLRTSASLDPVIGHLPQGGSLQYKLDDRTIDLRLSTVPCGGAEKLTLRLLDPRRMEHRIHELGLGSRALQQLELWSAKVSGLLLVTGPTGSGKTTTLYSLVHEFELSSHSVLTIEDPIECPFDGINQIQVNETAGLTFAAALKSMLRLDPDYLLIGEMRDSDSARVALEATATGHCVMSTLHSPDATGVVTLLRNWGIADHYLASALQIVINQRLVRRLCRHCRQPAPPTAAQRTWLRKHHLRPPVRLWQAVGCPACQNTGYHGRIGVFEVWQKHGSDYDLMLSHADEQTLRRHLRKRGLPSLLQDALAKARTGVTSLAEVQTIGAVHS